MAKLTNIRKPMQEVKNSGHQYDKIVSSVSRKSNIILINFSPQLID